MKTTFVVFALLIAAVAANPIFQSEDIGEEFVPKPAKEEDWHLVPDTDGFMHLVDINSVDMDAEPLFNAESDVIFHLFTRQNPTAPQNIALGNNAQLAASNFVAGLQTRMHTHGWGAGSHNSGSQIRDAFLQHMNCNVFIINWSAGSDTANYILARNRVNEVGVVIARYIDWLNSHGAAYANIVVMGHSLGAHVAAAGAKRINGRLPAVVGLCPAGPLFSLDDPANRIDHTDANYVELMLTDSGRLGTPHALGHGTSQPGCGIDLAGSCGHGMVIQFYAASINMANNFEATRCSSQQAIADRNCPAAGPSARMGGEPINNSGPIPPGSIFFVPTSATYPFAQGPR